MAGEGREYNGLVEPCKQENPKFNNYDLKGLSEGDCGVEIMLELEI